MADEASPSTVRNRSLMRMPVILRFLVIAAIMVGPLSAASWTGAAQSDRWSDAGNWAEGAAPGPDDEAVFLAAMTRPAVNDLARVRAVVVGARDVVLVGGALVAQRIEVRGGNARIELPLVIAEVQVAASTRLELRGPVTIAGDRLRVLVEGDLRMSGAVGGTGLVDVTGRGELTLANISTWRGGMHVRHATLRLARDAPASGPGALGDGDEPLRLAEATLVLASAVLARPLTIATGGATLRAEGGARTLNSPVSLAAAEGAMGVGALVGTYLSGSRRELVADDWRTPDMTAEMRRDDAAIAFLSTAFGTGDERRRFKVLSLIHI